VSGLTTDINMSANISCWRTNTFLLLKIKNDAWPKETHARHKGAVSGAVVRVLASYQCGPDSIPALCHTWVEFIVGFRVTLRFLLRFSSLHKNHKSPNFNLTRIEDPHENQLLQADVQFTVYLFFAFLVLNGFHRIVRRNWILITTAYPLLKGPSSSS